MQGLMVSRKNRIAQIIEVSATVFATVALALSLGVILAVFNHLATVTLNASYFRRPTGLAHNLIALGIID